MNRPHAPRARRAVTALALAVLLAALFTPGAAAQDEPDTLRFWDVPEDSEPDAPMRLPARDGILQRATFG